MVYRCLQYMLITRLMDYPLVNLIIHRQPRQPLGATMWVAWVRAGSDSGAAGCGGWMLGEAAKREVRRVM